MKRFLLILLLAPLLCLGQAFGPKIIKGPTPVGTIGPPPDIPDTMTGKYFRWVSLDKTTNAYVSSWTDRIQGAVFSMGDSVQQPYNTALGMEFDGHNDALTNYPGFVVETNTTVMFWVWVRKQSKWEQNKGLHQFTSSKQQGAYGFYVDDNGNAAEPETINRLRRGSTNSMTTVLFEPSRLGIYEDVIVKVGDLGTTIWTNGVMYDATNVAPNDPWIFGGIGGTVNTDLSTNNARFILSEFILFTNRGITLPEVSNLHYYATSTYTNDPYSPEGTTNWHSVNPVLRNAFKNDAVTPCVDGDAIRYLFNDKGIYYHMFAGAGDNTGGRYLATGGPNGYPAVDTSTNIFQYYDCYLGRKFQWNNPFTMYFVAKVTDSSTDNGLTGSSGGGACDIIISSGAGGSMTGGSNLALPAYASTGWTLFVASWNGANSFIRTNGQWYVYGDTGSTSVQLWIAMQNGATNLKWKGYVTEFGIGHFAISTNETLQLETWARRKFNLW